LRRNWKNRKQRASKKPRAYKDTLRARAERHQARHPNDKSHELHLASRKTSELDRLKANANMITTEHLIVNNKGKVLVCGQSAGEAHGLLEQLNNHDYFAVGSELTYHTYDHDDDGFNLMLTYTTAVRRIFEQPKSQWDRIDGIGCYKYTTVKTMREECKARGLKVSGNKNTIWNRLRDNSIGEEE